MHAHRKYEKCKKVKIKSTHNHTTEIITVYLHFNIFMFSIYGNDFLPNKIKFLGYSFL